MKIHILALRIRYFSFALINLYYSRAYVRQQALQVERERWFAHFVCARSRRERPRQRLRAFL